MAKINLKKLDKRVYKNNSLIAYIRLGELIKKGLVVQHGDCRHGIVKVELTKKGRDVLFGVSSSRRKEIQDSLKLHNDDLCFLDLIDQYQKDSLDQIQETASVFR